QPLIEDHDPIMAGAQPELILGTDHSLAFLPTDLSFFDHPCFPFVRIQGSPDRGHGNFLPRGDIGGPADDLQGGLLSNVDSGQFQTIRIWMLYAAEDLAHDDALQSALDGFKF